ncbi:hypothetical protein N7463_002918 [Penicillium fimorum]|uniref:SP-RING-type domain-containing protein n=1 Tax=Penicillium fimorum TaxID=1882269 RepID=A0A9X0C8Y0_9EURO|nr:hypothetical protein N7463_002918 [Penicillium fimorum]
MSATPSRRQSSQAHPQSAQSRRLNATHTSISETTPLPEYQTPEAPLTAESQRQIAALLASHHLRNLRTHLQHAAEKLAQSGGEVNERLSDARIRYEKRKEARRRQGDENVDDDENNEEYQRLAEAEAQVDGVTARMEEKTRQIVDSEIKLQGLTDAVGQIEREEGENVATALGVRQTRQQRARQRAHDDDADGTEDPTDGDYEDAQEREMRERNVANPPSRKLVDKLTEGAQKWDELSLTERYASNNSYIGFYRMVHDAKFPGDDVPPLPHSSTWFEHMEDTNTRSVGLARTRNQRRGVSPADSDDDIAIERERISLKCPLTLTPYQDPVTSTKCPHSFEREAIMDMISHSQTTIAPPASRRGQRRVHVVKCPVCSTPLTADDLRPDAVLLRRVRRAQELQQREEEDDHLEGDGRKQKDRSTGITLGSDGESDDDAMDVDAPLVAQSDDESSDDAESQDADIEDGENAEGESDEGDNEEGDEEAEIEQEPNEEVDIDEPHDEQAQNQEVQIDEPDNEEAENEEVETDEGEIAQAQSEEEENEEMETDEPKNEVENEEPDNEEAEIDDGEIEQAQDEEEQKEAKETDASENEEAEIEPAQNEEEQNEEMETDESENEAYTEEPDNGAETEQGEVENGDVDVGSPTDMQPANAPSESDESDSDSEDSEGSDSEGGGDSDIEPKVESGSEDEVESH